MHDFNEYLYPFLEVGDEELDPEKKFVEAKKKKLFADRTLIIKDFVEHGFEWIVDNKPH